MLVEVLPGIGGAVNGLVFFDEVYFSGVSYDGAHATQRFELCRFSRGLHLRGRTHDSATNGFLRDAFRTSRSNDVAVQLRL